MGSSYVVIKVPLKDGTAVYLEGIYEEYGYVTVRCKEVGYKFYLEEFEEYFKGWFKRESEAERARSFKASTAWTTYDQQCDYRDYDRKDHVVKRYCYEGPKTVQLTEEILSKCIRADTGLDIKSDAEKKNERIAELTREIARLQKELALIQEGNR